MDKEDFQKLQQVGIGYNMETISEIPESND